MAIFEEVVLTWQGRSYPIPPNMVLRAIAKVEDVLPMADLAQASAKRSYPLAKMAIAYGSLLRMAGAAVTDEEVYRGMFHTDQDEFRTRVVDAMHVLQLLMIPPEFIRSKLNEKKDVAAGPSPAVSSPPATGSSAGTDG